MDMKSDVLALRLFEDALGALDLTAVYLGDQLGYYRAMAGGEWFTATGLAGRTGTAARYAEEWLSHQAVRQIVEVEDVKQDPRRYRLPTEHVAVLVDPDSVMNAVGGVTSMARHTRRLPELVTAFRTGQGLAPQAWGPEGRAEPSRGQYLNLLGKQWLPSIPEIDRRLRGEQNARIADIACGTGWSSIAMAQAYRVYAVLGEVRHGQRAATWWPAVEPHRSGWRRGQWATQQHGQCSAKFRDGSGFLCRGAPENHRLIVVNLPVGSFLVCEELTLRQNGGRLLQQDRELSTVRRCQPVTQVEEQVADRGMEAQLLGTGRPPHGTTPRRCRLHRTNQLGQQQ